MLVYVLKQNGQPFMPTARFGKVRRLLKAKKAKVVRREPFTIKLLYEPETDVVQECYCGVDTGSKHVGMAVVGNDRVLYQSQTELRNDIKRKMDTRRMYRCNRRSRKTRYRKPRFLNRGNSTKSNRIPPSVKRYSSRREAVLHRDNYTCQCCGKKNCRLEVHHVKFKSDGGTDDEENLITLCEDCHKGVHAGTVVLSKKPKKSKNLKYATHMSIIRSRLLKKYPNAIETFGFVTSENRNHLNLPKDHFIDACVIAGGGLEIKELDVVYKKRRVSVQDRVLTKGVRGEQKLPTGKIFGFKKFDKVEYLGETCFIKGRRSSGAFVLMDIDNNSIDFRDRGGEQNPSYKSIKRLNTRRNILCISRRIEKRGRAHSYTKLKT